MEQSGRMFQYVPGGKNNMMERGWKLNQEVVRNHDEAREERRSPKSCLLYTSDAADDVSWV